jgi:hypothetical protein
MIADNVHPIERAEIRIETVLDGWLDARCKS